MLWIRIVWICSNLGQQFLIYSKPLPLKSKIQSIMVRIKLSMTKMKN